MRLTSLPTWVLVLIWRVLHRHPLWHVARLHDLARAALDLGLARIRAESEGYQHSICHRCGTFVHRAQHITPVGSICSRCLHGEVH